MDRIKVQLCGRDTKFIINNMYPLYLHDLAGIRNVLPNKYGVSKNLIHIKLFNNKYQYLTFGGRKTTLSFHF